MFSATKLVVAAASVALFGALLVAGPLSLPGEDSAPAAVPPAQPGNVTHFSGTLRFLGQDHMGVVSRHDWGTEALGEQWTVRTEVDDPRYSGVHTAFHNAYVIEPGGNDLRSFNGRLFTKDGSWQTVGRAYTDPETGGLIGHEYAVGEGDYEGLYALTTLLQKPGSSLVDLKGIIFEGGLPETPADAPTEIPPIHLEP